MVIKINYTSSDVYVSTSVSPVYVVVNYSGTSGGGGNFVPYTGATGDVDLGEFELKAGQVEFDQTPTGAGGVGVMRWNDSDGTVDLGLKGGNVTLQVGQEQILRVVNKTGADLLESQYRAVRIRLAAEGGSQGQRLAVVLAQGNNDANSTDTIGIVTETITNNLEGFICTSGIIRGINTTGSLQGETWADGDIIYLSPTIAGAITTVKPTAPNHSVILGYVIYAHNVNGKIFVKCDNGYELGELHDVYAPTPSNNDGIFWNSTNLRYENKTIAGALGYTPVPTTRTLTINGTAHDLSADRSWTVSAAAAGSNTQIQYNNAGAFAGSANLVWDNSNSWLGIGTNTLSSNTRVSISESFTAPTSIGLRVKGVGSSTGIWKGRIVAGGDTVAFLLGEYNSKAWLGGHNAALNAWAPLYLNPDGATDLYLGNTGVSNPIITIRNSTGNVTIGSGSDAGFRLDVNGSAQITGALTVTGTSNSSSLQFQLSSYKFINIGDFRLYRGGATVGDLAFLTDDSTSKIKWGAGGSSTAQMTLTAAGRLLLGTTTESTYLLDVNGTARVSGNLEITAGSILKFSDNRVQIGTSSATANFGIAIGSSATTNASEGTAIGNSASTNGGSASVAIGRLASTTGGGISIGGGSTSVNGVAIQGTSTGSGITISGTASSGGLSLGLSSISNSFNSVAIGREANASHNPSIAIGYRAITTAANQCVIGGADAGVLGYSITDVYIGSGVQDGLLGNAVNVTINASGGGAAINKTGGNITIAGGKGTGAGTSGDVIISTATTTTSGTTLQSLTERLRVKGTQGSVRFIPIATPASAEAGDVYYDSSTNKLRCYNGTSWNDLF